MPLVSKNSNYFRGSRGAAARRIMSRVVGPAQAVADFIFNQEIDIPTFNGDPVLRFFTDAICGQTSDSRIHVPVPDGKLASSLGILLKHPRRARSNFTIFEHVLYEPEAQIHIRSTAGLLESLTSDPEVAILYAYGIRPDPWRENPKRYEFHSSNGPNAAPFIAILPQSDQIVGVAQICLELASRNSSIAIPGISADEAIRRVRRDSEVLARGPVVTINTVDLPDWVPGDDHGSFRRAGEALAIAGYCDWT